jgi:hypothetical protein
VGNGSNRFASAFKHGAYSGTTLLPGEDPAAFKKLHANLINELKPVGPLEEDIVTSVARLLWRKQNLSTYLFARLAKDRVARIRAEKMSKYSIPIPMVKTDFPDPDPAAVSATAEAANEQARKELGPALQLVQMDDDVGSLLQELAVIDRLEAMIDRCLKRLLMVRGVKSMSLSVSEASSPPRKRLNAA